MKAFILLIFTAAVLQCGNQKQNGDKKDSTSAKSDIEFKTIGQGSLYGNGEEGIPPQNIIIDNQEEWKSLQKKMNAVNEVTFGFSETDIDFSKFTLLAAFDKVRGHGGVSIEIKKLSENEEEVKFAAETHSPKGMATAVMNQPYHIVKIPITKKKIIFE